jgi:hypothetical protein
MAWPLLGYVPVGQGLFINQRMADLQLKSEIKLSQAGQKINVPFYTMHR